jgi:hypothetical protein
MDSQYIMNGNTHSIRHIVTNLAIGNCVTKTHTETAITVPGAAVGDNVVVTCVQTFEAGLCLAGHRVSAANTVQIGVINPTAGDINPADTFDFSVVILKGTGAVS